MAEGSRTFDKELFKRSVVYNVKTLYRRDRWRRPREQQIFQAVCYAVKDAIIDAWMCYPEGDEKTGSEDRVLHVHGISHGAGSWQQPDQPDAIMMR